MKTITTFFLLAFMSLQVFACTFAPQDFCYSASYFDDATIIRGILTNPQTNRVELTILDVYRGVETRQAVTIWDGDDLDCNGPLPMNVSYLGNVGDTVVLLLPVIDSIVNNWEVIGDYRCSYLWFYTPKLQQQKDSLVWTYGNSTQRVSLQDFVKDIDQCANQSVSVDPTQETFEFEAYPNPAKDRVVIRPATNLPYTITLYDLHGKAIRSQSALGEEIELDVTGLSAGIYTLTLKHAAGISTERILVRGF